MSCGNDKAVIVWDVATGRIINKYRGHTAQVRVLMRMHRDCFSDSFWWYSETKKYNFSVRHHISAIFPKVLAVRFNADCTVVASSSYDATVQLWDLRSKSYEPIQVREDIYT